MTIYNVLLISGFIVLIATGVLYFRTKLKTVLGMLVGILLVWSSIGLFYYGPKVTRPYIPNGFAVLNEEGNFGTIEVPLPIYEPMSKFGLVIFGVSFFIYSIRVNKSVNRT